MARQCKSIDVLPFVGESRTWISEYRCEKVGKEKQNDILILLHTSPQRGLARMIEVYSGYVCAIVKQKMPQASLQDVEECASDVFYAVYQSRECIDERKGSLKAFLCTVAKRKAIDCLRKNARHAHESWREDYDSLQATDHVQNAVEENEQKNALVRAIGLLGEVDAQIVTRRYYFGQSIKEIAAALCMNENAVSKRNARAMQKLGQILEREGFSYE